jgi:hypothetical protein
VLLDWIKEGCADLARIEFVFQQRVAVETMRTKSCTKSSGRSCQESTVKRVTWLIKTLACAAETSP